MVWPAAEPVRNPSPVESANVASPSPSPSASFPESLRSHSFQPPQQQHHRRQTSTNRPHHPRRDAIPPASPSPSPSQSQSQSTQDWHHSRQQQWLDRIPYDLPPQHPLLESSQSTSSMPSTGPMPHGFVNMPGSYHSRSSSPSSDEQAMFCLAHDSSPPSLQPTNTLSNRLLSPPPSSLSPSVQDPFPPIPSAQPRPPIPHHSSSSSSPYDSSPPPFTNISYSTQAASSLPSPPTSQHEPHRPASPLSVADSQPTLRQGVAPRQEYESWSPMSPIPRPQVMSHVRSHGRGHDHGRGGGGGGSDSGSGSGNGIGNGNRRYPRTAEETEAQALNAVVEGIGRMQVNMNLDQAGRWRIARRADAPW
ncbi:hypothetical protein J3F83DRAFT_297413 [Trichoderma novae-zelandiae]